jgi:hypothetical protein
MKRIYGFLIIFLTFSHLHAQTDYNPALKYLNDGYLDKSVKEFELTIKKDSLSHRSSKALDALYSLSKAQPGNYSIYYAAGVLSARLALKYDACYFLRKYIENTSPCKYVAEAEKILDTLKIDNNDLRYVEFIRKYLDDVEASKTNLESYWDEETKKRLGSNFDYYFLYNDYKEAFEQSLFFPVKSIRHTGDYTIVDAGGFSYAVTEQHNALKLSQPIILLTRNWNKKESRHFVFHFEDPSNLPDSSLINRLDSFYEGLSSKFQVNNNEKIDYYLAGAETIGKFYFRAPVNGIATAKWNIVSSVSWDNYHEIVHIITPRALNFNIPLLGEGIAVYYAGTTYFSNLFSIEWTKELMLKKKDPGIHEIYLIKDFTHSEKYNTGDIYFTAGAFSKYLIEKYDMDKYSDLCSRTTSDTLFPSAIGNVYHQSIAAIEHDFRNWMLNLQMPEISPFFNEKAEEVFNMADPEKDDSGNGKYIYPKDRYCRDGIFDLTKFRILKDKSRYYFEMTFRDLANRDSVEWGFYRTYAVIYLKNNDNKTRIHDWSGNIDLEGKFDQSICISDKGILLQNYDDTQVLSMKLNKTDDNIFGDVRSKTIRFSVPKEFLKGIGKRCWLFAGIGASDISSGLEKYWDSFIGSQASISGNANGNNGGCSDSSEFLPYYYDVLLPKETDQKEIFSGYSNDRKTRALFPYILIEKF